MVLPSQTLSFMKAGTVPSGKPLKVLSWGVRQPQSHVKMMLVVWQVD